MEMTMKTSDFYAVAPLAPVNSTAGRVASRGEHFVYKPKASTARSHAPLPCGPKPDTPQFVDLTGMKVGRLTVVGYAVQTGENKSGSLWNVRCVCGFYEQRRRKALLKATSTSCSECHLVEQNRKLYRQENKHHLAMKKLRRCE
jgi:hypothetical protein